MSTIDGYASLTSVTQGTSIDFCISNSPTSSASDSFTADIYYEGKSRIHKQTLNGKAGSYVVPALGYKTGYYWPPALTFTIPSDQLK